MDAACAIRRDPPCPCDRRRSPSCGRRGRWRRRRPPRSSPRDHRRWPPSPPRRPASRRSRRRGCRMPLTSAPIPTAACSRPSDAPRCSTRPPRRTTTPSPAARTPGLHGVEARRRSEPHLAQAVAHRGCEGAAADLHEDAVELVGHPVAPPAPKPSVRPPSRHSAFSGPCTLNGMAPASTASRKRWMHGSPGGSPARRGHVTTVAPSPSRRASTPGSAFGGTNTSRAHDAAAASVAAASAALPHDAMASGGRSALRAKAAPLGGDEVQQHTHQVTGLVGTGDVAGLVLDPHPTVGGEPELVRQGIGPLERRRAEANAIDLGHRGVELAHQRHRARVRHGVGAGEGVPCHPLAVGDERVRIIGRRFRHGPVASIRNTWARSAQLARGQRHGHGSAMSRMGAAHGTPVAGCSRCADGGDAVVELVDQPSHTST